MSNVVLPSPPNQAVDSGSRLWRDGRPFLFCVTAPDSMEPLYDVALALHTNPETIDEKMTKSKTVTPTYGGFVEFIWPDELDSISGSGSTGGFINPNLGYTAAQTGIDLFKGGRQDTMAYERFQDFLELFRMNGMVFDGRGEPALRGRVIMIYDRGIFFGHFVSFEPTEEDTKPFSFNLNWEFKVERSIYKFNSTSMASPTLE